MTDQEKLDLLEKKFLELHKKVSVILQELQSHRLYNDLVSKPVSDDAWNSSQRFALLEDIRRRRLDTDFVMGTLEVPSNEVQDDLVDGLIEAVEMEMNKSFAPPENLWVDGVGWVIQNGEITEIGRQWYEHVGKIK